MSKQLTPEHSEIILKEMCRRVGMTDEDYRVFDFTEKEWFRKHEWTEKEEQDFILWLADFLEENKYVPKKIRKRGIRWAGYESSKFVMSLGWKTKYDVKEKR